MNLMVHLISPALKPDFFIFGNFLGHSFKKIGVLLNIDGSSSRYLLWRFWIVDGKGKMLICLCPDYTKKLNNKKG